MATHQVYAVIRIRPASTAIVAYFYNKEEAETYAEEFIKGDRTKFSIVEHDITLDSSPFGKSEDNWLDGEEEEPEYWDDEDEDAIRHRMFADPGGNSALRAATKNNPRNLPCPTCGRPNLLTPEDRHLGYQCDRCADRAERGVDY